MNNIWLVAQHEFITNIRKKSFLFAVFGVPLMMAGIFAIVFLVSAAAEDSGIVADNIGYVDASNLISVESEQFTPFEDTAAAQAALDAGTTDVFFELQEDYLSSG